MTAVGYKVGQKMRQERRQARTCKDPELLMVLRFSASQWDLGAPSQGGWTGPCLSRVSDSVWEGRYSAVQWCL